MKYSRTLLIFIVVYITLSFPGYIFAYDLKPVILNPDYKHDRFNTQTIAFFISRNVGAFLYHPNTRKVSVITIFLNDGEKYVYFDSK